MSVQKLVNLILYCSNKHVKIKHHFAKDYLQKGSLDLNFISNGNELDTHSICIQNHESKDICIYTHVSPNHVTDIGLDA
ncbi:hypothetical protein CR513_34810, partial [Mucuna pruriens]